MTRAQAYKTRARREYRELQRTEPYRLGAYRRRRDWSGYVFVSVVLVVATVAVFGFVVGVVTIIRIVAGLVGG